LKFGDLLASLFSSCGTYMWRELKVKEGLLWREMVLYFTYPLARSGAERESWKGIMVFYGRVKAFCFSSLNLHNLQDLTMVNLIVQNV